MAKVRLPTLKEQYDEWFDHCVRSCNPSTDQVVEMRKAFYSGASAMLFAVTDAPSDDMSDKQIADYYKSLHREAAQFFELIGGEGQN